MNERLIFFSSPVPSASEHKRGPYHHDRESEKAQGPEVPVIEHSPNEWTHKGKQAWAQRYTSMGAKINKDVTEGCMGEQASLGFDMTFGYVLLHELVQAY